MKKLILLLLVISPFITLTSFSQMDKTTSINNFPINEKGEVVYTEIVKIDSTDSKELYVKAHEWFANTFNSAQNVVQLDDKDAGTIIGKGVFEFDETVMVVWVNFTIEIQTKDGKYKYTLSNFIYKGYRIEEITFDTSDIQKLNLKILSIIDGLKKSMQSNTNNW
jgi:hypothetical protein